MIDALSQNVSHRCSAVGRVIDRSGAGRQYTASSRPSEACQMRAHRVGRAMARHETRQMATLTRGCLPGLSQPPHQLSIQTAVFYACGNGPVPADGRTLCHALRDGPGSMYAGHLPLHDGFRLACGRHSDSPDSPVRDFALPGASFFHGSSGEQEIALLISELPLPGTSSDQGVSRSASRPGAAGMRERERKGWECSELAHQGLRQISIPSCSVPRANLVPSADQHAASTMLVYSP